MKHQETSQRHIMRLRKNAVYLDEYSAQSLTKIEPSKKEIQREKTESDPTRHCLFTYWYSHHDDCQHHRSKSFQKRACTVPKIRRTNKVIVQRD